MGKSSQVKASRWRRPETPPQCGFPHKHKTPQVIIPQCGFRRKFPLPTYVADQRKSLYSQPVDSQQCQINHSTHTRLSYLPTDVNPQRQTSNQRNIPLVKHSKRDQHNKYSRLSFSQNNLYSRRTKKDSRFKRTIIEDSMVARIPTLFLRPALVFMILTLLLSVTHAQYTGEFIITIFFSLYYFV